MNLHCYVCKMWGHTKVNCPMKKVPPSTQHRAAPRSTAHRAPHPAQQRPAAPSSAQQRTAAHSTAHRSARSVAPYP